MKAVIKYIFTPSAGLFLITATSASVAPEQLGASEIKQLFSGNTVHSLHLIRDHETTLYYNPDGRFYGISDDSIHQGKWEVRGDATICLILESGTSRCRPIMKENDTYFKFKIKDNGEVKKLIEYKTFIPGNPKNYDYVD